MVGKNPGLKKTSPMGFIVFFWLYWVFHFESSWNLQKFMQIHYNKTIKANGKLYIYEKNSIVVIIGLNYHKYSWNTLISHPFLLGDLYRGNTVIFLYYIFMDFRLLFSYLDTYFWLGVCATQIIYMLKKEDHYKMPRNFRSLTHKNDKGI